MIFFSTGLKEDNNQKVKQEGEKRRSWWRLEEGERL
jgi:hypothetical protein